MFIVRRLPGIFNQKKGIAKMATAASSQFRYTLDNPRLTTEQRQFYEDNGFILIKNSIDHSVLDECAHHLTPSHLYEESLKKIQAYKYLNAFITLNETQSLEDSTTRYQKQLPKGLLDGVPIAVKDNFSTKGLRTTCGSKMLTNYVPSYNATVVSRLLSAGAVLMGKTNLDEFGMGSGCVDSAFGPTRNFFGPKNEDWVVAGGSSGGSAAAVASGAVFAAIGSDTGGSIRAPASYCGLVGFKPTYGAVSRFGLIPLVNSMDTPGILAKTVDDVSIVFDCILGWDDNDSTTSTYNCQKANREMKTLRIGVPKEYYTDNLSEESLNAWMDAVELLRQAGATIREVTLPHTRHSIVCYSVLSQCEIASNMARYDGLQYGERGESTTSTEQLFAETRAKNLGQVVRRRILCGNYFLLSENYEKYFVKALQVRRLIANDFENVWKNVDILVTPTMLSDAPRFKDFIMKDQREQSSIQDYFTQPANMSGCPAISVPLRFSKKKLPLSVQLLAPNFSDWLLLQRFRDLCNGADKGFMTLMKDISLKDTNAKGEYLYYKVQDIVYDEVFSKYTGNDQILDMVECFTGPDITAMHSMLINKPPDSGKMTSTHPLHQDLHYFPFRPTDRIVAAWTAMEKVNEENGCLVVIPGSHKGQLLQHDYPDWEGGVNKAFHGIKGYDNVPTVKLEMEKGDTVFFHPILIHGSGPNLTKNFRKAISCHYSTSHYHHIDVRGTTQENIAIEIEEMAKKKGLGTITFEQVWDSKSRAVRGKPRSKI